MAPQLTLLTQKATEAANAFRLGYEGKANALYTEFIDALTVLLSAHGLEGNQTLHQVFKVMFEAHKRGDKLFLADTLQHDLPVILQQYIPEPIQGT